MKKDNVVVSRALAETIAQYGDRNDKTYARVVEDAFSTLLSVENDPNLKGFKVRHWLAFEGGGKFSLDGEVRQGKPSSLKPSFHDHIESQGYGMTNENGEPLKLVIPEISREEKENLLKIMKEDGDSFNKLMVEFGPSSAFLSKKEWDKQRLSDLSKEIKRLVDNSMPVDSELIEEYNSFKSEENQSKELYERKRIRAWFTDRIVLYEVDEVNKKLLEVSFYDLKKRESRDRDTLILNVVKFDRENIEQWFRNEPGASGEVAMNHIKNYLAPGHDCFFFTPHSSNHHEELERQYFKVHENG